MRKKVCKTKKKLMRYVTVSMAALMMVTTSIFPKNVVSAQETKNIESKTTVMSGTKFSFNATIEKKKTGTLGYLASNMAAGGRLFIYMASFSGAGPLSMYISSSQSVAPSTGEVVSLNSAGVYYLTIPSNPSGKCLFATNESTINNVSVGGYFQEI